MDFVARKNALASQQFEFADKLAAYNAQVKLFNENLEKLEAERTALFNERQQYDEEKKEFDKNKTEFDEAKAKLNQEQAELEKERMDANKKALDEKSGLHTTNTQSGISGSFRRRSPLPSATAVPPITQNGTSLPTMPPNSANARMERG